MKRRNLDEVKRSGDKDEAQIRHDGRDGVRAYAYHRGDRVAAMPPTSTVLDAQKERKREHINGRRHRVQHRSDASAPWTRQKITAPTDDSSRSEKESKYEDGAADATPAMGTMRGPRVSSKETSRRVGANSMHRHPELPKAEKRKPNDGGREQKAAPGWPPHIPHTASRPVCVTPGQNRRQGFVLIQGKSRKGAGRRNKDCQWGQGEKAEEEEIHRGKRAYVRA
ncbi:hypothetical protein B0H16DRAFT_1455217 [Mycena metata]|uniref:Uncharacterized protein n=1 Tax=Mycena metata TaxID=1033252 RepID=A0AAD7JGK0_9AGAR|nr:hypothetical protein B0H16DRAFT_1455217 [Mycena metata]